MLLFLPNVRMTHICWLRHKVLVHTDAFDCDEGACFVFAMQGTHNRNWLSPRLWETGPTGWVLVVWSVNALKSFELWCLVFLQHSIYHWCAARSLQHAAHLVGWAFSILLLQTWNWLQDQGEWREWRELACCLGSGSFNQLDLLFESAAALSADLHFCALSTAPLSVDPLAFCRNYAFV